jgi:small GTP-binding protein
MNCDIEPEQQINIIIVGDRKVGKSSILSNYTDNKVNEYYEPTIGCDFRLKYIYGKQTQLISFWDISLPDSIGYNKVRRQYYEKADGIILVYDIANKESFENINLLLNDINVYGNKNAVKILIGNKKDNINNNEIVTTEMGQHFADIIKTDFMETSAKNNYNIHNLFNNTINAILKN